LSQLAQKVSCLSRFDLCPLFSVREAQLRTAHEHYSKQGTVLGLVVTTTAEQMGDDLAAARKALSADLRVPVNMILRKQMLEILANGLMASLDRKQVIEGTEDVS
jgi:hypothetical protein